MPERKLWNMIKDRKLDGLKFRRQHPIGPYTTDFYCAAATLVVELDSSWHAGRVAEDKRRDAYMRSLGIATIRIRCSAVDSDGNWVLHRIADAARASIETLKMEMERKPLTGSA